MESDTSTEGMQETLHQVFEQLQAQSLAATSKSKYNSTWSQWSQWCERHNFSKWLPENPSRHSYQLALFATYCWQFGWNNAKVGNSANTVLSEISHISWHHRRMLGYGVSLLPGHQLAITGMRRSDPPTNPKYPVTIDILKRMHELLDFELSQHRVIWGASVLGFFFILRKSAYLAEGSTVQSYAIRRSDIRFMGSDDEECKNLLDVIAVVVQFRGSKSDQFGEGTSRRLERSGSRWCCPVLAAWFLVSHHKTLGVAPESHLCRIDSSTNLQVRDVVKVIKMAAAKAGYHPKRFGSHSLRSGGATALFNAGFDSLAVELFRRWKSDAVERYTRIGRRLTEKMAQQMITKSTSARSLGVSATPHPGSGQHE
ncbi:hypothetical protein F443_22572 [Phytophthora nicotianae P1569]|uniref:Tyr recombinase domain-containing protein n=1 Tax=Phytophthora nicotianae P1569 TaxID=1317065 RepID=V9DTW4_PHYNI|nr:hypothetical protein F443_22572 [Phytophthora nicotianae P1569]